MATIAIVLAPRAHCKHDHVLEYAAKKDTFFNCLFLLFKSIVCNRERTIYVYGLSIHFSSFFFQLLYVLFVVCIVIVIIVIIVVVAIWTKMPLSHIQTLRARNFNNSNRNHLRLEDV